MTCLEPHQLLDRVPLPRSLPWSTIPSMSATAPVAHLADRGRRPSLFRLIGAVLGGEVLAAVELWVATIVLALLGVAPLGAGDWIWLPWQVDGAWALLGAIGWGYLVSTLVAATVRRGIERRGYGRPAAGWMRISIAVSGYGAMAIGHTPGAHMAAAVIGGAIVIRLVAFNLDGSVREWRWSAPPRAGLAGATAAVIVAFSYSGLHSLAATGDGGTFSSGVVHAHVGHTTTISVGLSHMLVPIEITDVGFGGPGSAHLSASGLIISPDPGLQMIPRKLRSYPGAHRFRGFAWHPTPLPYRVGSGTTVWVTMNVQLRACAEVTVNVLELRYRVLGIGTGETIALRQPLTLSCRA